jgi:hypothetical protein
MQANRGRGSIATRREERPREKKWRFPSDNISSFANGELLYILKAYLEVVYVGLGRRFYLPVLEVPGGVGHSKHRVLKYRCSLFRSLVDVIFVSGTP